MSCWNQRVEDQGGGGKATLAGTLVGKLSCHAQGYQYQVHQGTKELDKETRHRRDLLESLWLNRPDSKAEKRFLERVRNWKELGRGFLLELYTLRQMIDSVNRRYYEGQQGLFPKAAEGFDELVGYIERLVGLYNRDLAEGMDRLAALVSKDDSQKSDEPFEFDKSAARKLGANPAKHQTAYLVDMAKVEALDTMGENRKAVELLDRRV